MSEQKPSPDGYRTYRVVPGKRARTVEKLLEGLQAAGCRILTSPTLNLAPFKVVLEAPDGERIGAIFYLFTITCVQTRNRPADECRFQIKYGARDALLHEIWQDPTELYTTVFLGIDPESGSWVAADPILHNPTKMFISLEFKQHQMEEVRQKGWHVWERESTIDADVPTEVLVGGRPERLLDLIRFERAAKGLDQGHRQLLATARLREATSRPSSGIAESTEVYVPDVQLHRLENEFQMDGDAILDLIATSPRLKMAVRGWVAEDHLKRVLEQVEGVTSCQRLNLEGKPDISLVYRGRGPILIECKNVLRQPTAAGLPRVDFQRTRASQGDRCSRYYIPTEFDVLAACLHAITERWEFRYRLPASMEPHKDCPGRLSNLVRVDEQWGSAERVLTLATSGNR